VYPGRTATPRQQAIHGQEGRSYVPERLMQPSDVAEMVHCALSLPRSAEVTEIAMRPMLKT
jgi:NADP-dependent 3-hydroxy acid dehydrogenase YdfG